MTQQREYILDNGWIVSKEADNLAILHVTPLPNSIFRIYQDIKLPNNILKDIEAGERSISKLFKKHKLHTLIIKWGKPKTIIPEENTPIKYFGKGFIVTQEDEKYFIEYLLSIQGGKSRKFEITRAIYEAARKGDNSPSALFKKYN